MFAMLSLSVYPSYHHGVYLRFLLRIESDLMLISGIGNLEVSLASNIRTNKVQYILVDLED